ncbi:MAG: hypothetical protein ABMB14_14555, partial [Myxococcota bacterium]
MVSARMVGVLGWLGLAGCSTVTVEGRVVDGLTGEPIPGPYRIKAAAKDPQNAAMSCQTFDTEVGADGKFVFDHLCAGSGYVLAPDRDDLWFVEIDEIPDGGWGQPTDLTAWRVPKASGVYHLANGALTMLKTSSEVTADPVFGTDQRVRLPDNIPDQVQLIRADEYLVLVGKSAVDELKLEPLVESGTRKFGTPDAPYTRPGPWWYLGVKFVDDTTIERVEAKLDPAKVVDKVKGDRHGRFVSGGAVPAGRYGLSKDGDRFM